MASVAPSTAINVTAVAVDIGNYFNVSDSERPLFNDSNFTGTGSDNGSWRVDLPAAEDGDDGGIVFQHPAIGALLVLFCVGTMFGNVLVMVAVARESYLRSATNYFIVSLATADLMIGCVVMPFAAVHEITSSYWLFGLDWCDVWHSVDVLACTASILNLCFISLDRYWAITDPMSYPGRMTTKTACCLIVLVWICASAISFPAILWWRAVAPNTDNVTRCQFTEDTLYLVLSSTVSFYVPLFIMLFTYYKIYRAATEQVRGIRAGQKRLKGMHKNGCNVHKSEMMLRIHKGGGENGKRKSAQIAASLGQGKVPGINIRSSGRIGRRSFSMKQAKAMKWTREAIPLRRVSEYDQPNVSELTKQNSTKRNVLEVPSTSHAPIAEVNEIEMDENYVACSPTPGRASQRSQLCKEDNRFMEVVDTEEDARMSPAPASNSPRNRLLVRVRSAEPSSSATAGVQISDTEDGCSSSAESAHGSPAHLIPMRPVTPPSASPVTRSAQKHLQPIRRLKDLNISKKLSRMAKEQRAAKTLGIVMGCFVLCWLPFFVANVMMALCGDSCVVRPEITMAVFTWLGYCNSGINPVIYAYSSRDFRRAFVKILFGCCSDARGSKPHDVYSTTNSYNSCSYAVNSAEVL